MGVGERTVGVAAADMDRVDDGGGDAGGRTEAVSLADVVIRGGGGWLRVRIEASCRICVVGERMGGIVHLEASEAVLEKGRVVSIGDGGLVWGCGHDGGGRGERETCLGRCLAWVEDVWLFCAL